jgi:HlyD family secretion protein
VDLEALKIDRSGTAPRARARRRAPWGWLTFAAVAMALGWLFRARIADLSDRLRLPEVEVVRATRTSAAAAAAVTGTAANGYVVARTRAALSADNPGRIVAMNVEEGTVVKKGDVVAELYSDEVAAALAAAQAELASSKTSVARADAEVGVAGADVARSRAASVAEDAAVDEARATDHLAEINLARIAGLVEQNIEPQQRLDEARAESERSHAALAAAQARLETAQRNEEQSVMRQSAASAALEEARSRLPVLSALRDQAKASLEKLQVRAPFDGVVVLKDAEVGEVVSPNAQGGQSRGSIATMVDFASLEVQVELPETSLPAVVVGAPATVFLDAYPSHGYSARVLRIWPTANRQKATVEVRVGFDAPDDKLRPELGARVVFQDSQTAQPVGEPAPDVAGRIVIPLDCIVKVDGASGAFVLERDVARFRALELGPEHLGRVRVDAGIEEGELVVVDPPASLGDGDRVRVAP